MWLAERVVLVTGASGAIGSEVVRLLGSSGANVIAQWSTHQDRVLEATSEMPTDRRLLLQADFTSSSEVRDLWNKAVHWRGHVDVLVNNAAVMPEAAIDGSDAAWDSAWDTALTINTIQPANLMRQAVNHYLGRGAGVIINVSSWAAQRGSGNSMLAAYSASKAATAAATKTIARAFAHHGILAYSVAPGPVDTEMTRKSAANQGGLDAVIAQLSMHELVPVKEVADLIVFLSSGKARHLTGATLDVNGASYIR